MNLLKKFAKIIVGLSVAVVVLSFAASADTGYVKGDYVNVRTGPSTGYAVVAVLPYGTQVTTGDITDGWYSISYNGITGYMRSDYIVLGTASTYNSDSGDMGTRIVNYAKQFLGYPYQYGAAGPYAFDCSGFTSYVFRHFGYSINRVAADQAKNGIAVSKDNLQPGDLVMFTNGYSGGTIGHVGIYIGEGQFIHSVKTGTPVSISSLTSGYYDNNYVCARRIVY